MRQLRDPKALLPPEAVVGLLLWSVLWAGCSGSSSLEGKLEAAIRSAATSGQPLRMEEVADFAWDELYVFGPYAEEEDFPQDLGSVSPGLFHISNENENLLVFVRDRKVVKSFYFPSAKGDFPLPYVMYGRFRREDAQFKVQGSGTLELLPGGLSTGKRAPRDGGSP